jgi:hypothetical protein
MGKLGITTLYTRRLNKSLKKWEAEIETRFAELRKDIDTQFDELASQYNNYNKPDPKPHKGC